MAGSGNTREPPIAQSMRHLAENTEDEMRTLTGEIDVENLPPHRGISATIAFFPIEKECDEIPYGGEPPNDAITDSEHVLEEVEFDIENTNSTRVIPFSVKRPAGYCYLQLRFILYRFVGDKAFAQVEQFFFGKKPLPLLDDINGIVLPVTWPSIPLEELGSFGMVEPNNS